MAEYEEQDAQGWIYSGKLSAMTGVDRSSVTSHLAIWASTGWLTLCLIVGTIFYSEGAKTERYRNQSYDYAKSAKENAKAACVSVDPGAVFDCVFDEAKRSREDARAEQDIDAQKNMALWAMLMFFTTIPSIGITAIGVWYVRKTLDATLIAVSSTVEATEAIIRQNNLAEQAQRPWLMINPKEWGPFVVKNERLTGTVIFEIKNVGASPASYVQVSESVFPTVPETWDSEKFYEDRRVAASLKAWGQILPPNGITYKSASVDVSWSETNRVIIGDDQKVIAPGICIAASYFAVGGATCLQTGMCFIVGRVEDGGFRVFFHEPRTYSYEASDIVPHPGACVIS